MSAFGKRSGLSGGGQRPNFGVASPMKSSGAGKASVSLGGEQFPPLEELEPSDSVIDHVQHVPGGAMDRLNSRQNASGDAASSKKGSERRHRCLHAFSAID